MRLGACQQENCVTLTFGSPFDKFWKVLTKKVVKEWPPIVSENLKKTPKIQKKKKKIYKIFLVANILT